MRRVPHIRAVTRPRAARRLFTSYRYFGFMPGSAVVRARL
jgi:hypothetical protein